MDFYTLFAQVVSITVPRLRLFIMLPLCIFLISCGEKPKEQFVQKVEADVVLHTDLGSIYVKLFDETPRHKANFLHLAEKGFFDSLSFNRIIYEFIIQSGDPRFINGGIDLSKGPGPGYTLDSEFQEHLVHTRGMLGAAREPDEENPERKSAGSQFYIVTGKPVRPAVLDTFEVVGTAFRKGNYYTAFTQEKDSGIFTGSFQEFLTKNKFTPFEYPLKQKQKYMQIGGAPHLDFSYTIFGEVVQGMEVVMAISKIPTNASEQPKDTIRILSVELPNRRNSNSIN